MATTLASHGRKAFTTALVACAAALAGCGTAPNALPFSSNQSRPMTEEQTRQAIQGDWTSIAPEVRPIAAKNADGTLKPFYLKRAFKALPGDRFELAIVNSADANGAVPLARILIKGHMLWRGAHRSRPARRRWTSWPTKPTRSRR